MMQWVGAIAINDYNNFRQQILLKHLGQNLSNESKKIDGL